MHGRNHLDIDFGTGHRNIQPPLAAHPVQGAEVVQQAALRINAVGNAENDRVALIALHCLKVLDEERLLGSTPEEVLLFRRILAPPGKKPVYQVLLGNAEGHHAKAAVRVLFNVAVNQVYNELRFLAVGMGPAVKNAVHMVVVYAGSWGIGPGRRKGDKLAVIEILVGEADELLIAAAVMPAQAKLLHGGRTDIQDRLKVRYVAGFFITVFCFKRGVKEVAGRHLL